MIEAITFDLWNTLFQNKIYSKARINFLSQYLTLKSKKLELEFIKKCYKNIFLYEKKDFEQSDRHIYNEFRIEKVLDWLS